MLQQLPESVDFIQQAERQGCFEGSWPIAELGRIREVVDDTTGDLLAKLEFGRCSGFYCLQGHVEASLGLLCQRCLKPMVYKVSGRFKLGLVSSEEQMDELPDDMEPYLVEGEAQSIIELLEDELLLSLPIAATHKEECSAFLSEQDKQRQADKEASSPFAVLKNLKTD